MYEIKLFCVLAIFFDNLEGRGKVDVNDERNDLDYLV